MSDLPRVLDWFAAGSLLRPNPEAPGTVHFARALAYLCGAPLSLAEPERQIAASIPEADHHVLVLADGLGQDLIDTLPRDAFLSRHVAMTLHSTFPSSTAPALTSIATGLWPARHGVPAWFAYLPDRGLHAITLPFRERFSGRQLSEFGVAPGDVFVSPPLWSALRRDACLFMSSGLAGTVYTRYASGGNPIVAYEGLEQAVEAILARLRTAKMPTFSYLYYSGVDSAAHTHGPGSRQVASEVLRLNAELERLSAGLASDACLLVTADHGGYDVAAEQKLLLEPGDALMESLLTPPGGESPVPFLHVLPGHEEEFAATFRAIAGPEFALLTVDEVDEMRLMGPEPLGPVTRARVGDFIGLSATGKAVVYAKDTAVVNMKGFHGGLSPSEVRVPLIVA